LSDEAPVRDRGFDHTTHGAIAACAGACRALGLDEGRAENAIAIATTMSPALRVTRTGSLSNWKGLAAPAAAELGLRAAFLAARGITGPHEAFEGNKGFMDAVSGPFCVDWKKEDLERVTRTSLKRFNAEVHAQSAVEGMLELVADPGLDVRRIERIEVEIFGVAHRIIGGGEEGDKTVVATKEQADHSLPYMLAVAALDKKLMPEQYMPERIASPDVQELLRRVVVREAPDLSARFPSEQPCVILVKLDDGRVLVKHKNDYRGYFTRPMTWEDARRKLAEITAQKLSPSHQAAIANAVLGLERMDVKTFCKELVHHEWRRAIV
jgi:2-methylcitrate dehydratase